MPSIVAATTRRRLAARSKACTWDAITLAFVLFAQSENATALRIFDVSTGRPCVICSDAEKTKLVATMIAEGATDGAIVARLGGGLHRMAVSRHRRNHVEAPARAIASAAAKGRDVVEQRAQTLAAAEAGDPMAYVGLAAIVGDLQRAADRLERTAAAAEHDNQRLAVASLGAQQLRAAEVRAKLGGVGGYAAAKAPGAGEANTPFVINFHFGDKVQTIEARATYPAPGATMDVAPGADDPIFGNPSPVEGARLPAPDGGAGMPRAARASFAAALRELARHRPAE